MIYSRVVLIFTALSAFALAQSHASAQSARFILESDEEISGLEQEVHRHGGEVIRKMDRHKGVVAKLDVKSLQRLRKANRNLKATEDIVMTVVANVSNKAVKTPTQPPQSIPWGMTAIGARAANLLNRGAGVKVCVVDTGVDKTHPDLMGNIAGGRNFVWNRGRVDSSAWNDDNGHGSHVSGVIAALDNAIGAVGVAPEAKLYAVKVLDSRGSGYLSDVTDGILECVNAGAKVINMSLGATSDPNLDSPLKSAVQTAVSAGIAVVVAAGNEGQDMANTVPAGYPATIAVAAVDSSMNFPSWSNFGLGLDDFSAPGVAIYSTWKSGTYNTISGTSMAAPHVAGVIALKISSGSIGLKSIDLSRPISTQGLGLIDAAGTVQNQP